MCTDVGRLVDNMGRENLIITVMLLIFLFALMFGGGDARKVETRRPKFPSKESVARAKALLDDNPVVDGYSYYSFVSHVKLGIMGVVHFWSLSFWTTLHLSASTSRLGFARPGVL